MGGKDLVPVTIWNAHEMSLGEIAEFFNAKVLRAKQNKDKEFNESTKIFGVIPTFIMQPISHIVTYCAANLNFELPPFGAKPDKFGHFLISNVGTLNFD